MCAFLLKVALIPNAMTNRVTTGLYPFVVYPWWLSNCICISLLSFVLTSFFFGRDAEPVSVFVYRYGVDFAVTVGDLALETTTGGLRTANVEVMLIVYDHEGKPLNAVTRRNELVLNPQSYAAAQAAGLQLHFDIDVPDDVLDKNEALSPYRNLRCTGEQCWDPRSSIAPRHGRNRHGEITSPHQPCLALPTTD